jgi:hypothetical protein
MTDVLDTQLPVYTVRGANWKINIPIDEFNVQFSADMQILEAATRAIEACKGLNDFFIDLDEGEEKPFIGPMLMVYLKDKSPEEGALVFTHNALADAGLYKESKAAIESLRKHIGAMTQEYSKHFEKKDGLLARQLAEFDAMVNKFKKPAAKKVVRKKRPGLDNPPSSK